MTRVKRAIEFAKEKFIEMNPRFIDKDYREWWWSNADEIDKMMFMETMTMLANHDLSRVEEIFPIDEN